MKPGDRYDSEYGFGVGTYYKPASVMVALRQMLGRETLEKAFREYGRRWRGKHPMPSDFFNTMDQVSGRDLSWYWREWFFETRTLDQAIESVEPVGDSTAIAIENKGKAVMPVPLAITREGGKVDSLTVPVNVWFDGTKRYVVKVAGAPKVTRVEIDSAHAFPDVNPGNNAWPRQRGVER